VLYSQDCARVVLAPWLCCLGMPYMPSTELALDAGRQGKQRPRYAIQASMCWLHTTVTCTLAWYVSQVACGAAARRKLLNILNR
jgi:hypothetical protein